MAKFAEQIERSQTQVSRLAGKNPTRNIGEKLARHIERVFCLPTYWLDQDRIDLDDVSITPDMDRQAIKHQKLHSALQSISDATEHQKIDEITYFQLLEIAKKILSQKNDYPQYPSQDTAFFKLKNQA